MSEVDIQFLKTQLSIARNEIKNLRQQITNLQHVQQKDIENIRCALTNYQCPSCTLKREHRSTADHVDNGHQESMIATVPFTPIGVIKTVFVEKRAVPRQANVAPKLISRIDINPAIFNNPEHSLEGLEEFSHIWIIYHFHRNRAHLKAKVAPPRLGGERIGVFSTRSPHRPCPIGLSLVQLDKIEDATIYFYGTDMVDDTPVLDIKPYIPQYDVPMTVCENNLFTSREAPDGEENSEEPTVSTSKLGNSSRGVTVPNWIVNNYNLNVVFNDNATQQVKELNIDMKSMVDILRGDPRSVYLRTKYGSQIYTFQLGDNTVTCKFDDQNSTVTVLQVRKVVDLNEMTNEATCNKTE